MPQGCGLAMLKQAMLTVDVLLVGDCWSCFCGTFHAERACRLQIALFDHSKGSLQLVCSLFHGLNRQISALQRTLRSFKGLSWSLRAPSKSYYNLPTPFCSCPKASFFSTGCFSFEAFGFWWFSLSRRALGSGWGKLPGGGWAS